MDARARRVGGLRIARSPARPATMRILYYIFAAQVKPDRALGLPDRAVLPSLRPR